MTWNRNLTAAQAALASVMSECSEEAVCAGWDHGCEYTLWAIMVGDSDEYMYLDVTPELRERLRRLSEACGGWIVWDDSEKWVPVDEWKAAYAKECERWKSTQSRSP